MVAGEPTKSDVSIHAPAGGATRERIKAEIEQIEFQSTRPRGARLAMAKATST